VVAPPREDSLPLYASPSHRLITPLSCSALDIWSVTFTRSLIVRFTISRQFFVKREMSGQVRISRCLISKPIMKVQVDIPFSAKCLMGCGGWLQNLQDTKYVERLGQGISYKILREPLAISINNETLIDLLSALKLSFSS
jgi:hypothetical protein